MGEERWVVIQRFDSGVPRTSITSFDARMPLMPRDDPKAGVDTSALAVPVEVIYKSKGAKARVEPEAVSGATGFTCIWIGGTVATGFLNLDAK
ncbi:MAG: hypothetical protein EOO38_17265, partial [Cytophagaceae bacterium]